MGKRIIVAGGRDFSDCSLLFEKCNEHFCRTDVLVNGACPSGADHLAYEWSVCKGFQCKSYPANWDKHGRAAGPIRNAKMAASADMLVAFWDGKSRGTRSMINEALKAGLEIHVYRY